jgi:hypothetical protein
MTRLDPEGCEVPDIRPCPAGQACVHGWTPARAWLEHHAELILLTAEAAGRPGAAWHPWLGGPGHPDVAPSMDAVELTTGLTGRAPRITGHDASDRWEATRSIIGAAGLDPATWGICPTCGGLGHHPDDEASCGCAS